MSQVNIPEQLLPELLDRFKDEKVINPSQPCLKECKKTGSEIWLDTGDMEAVDQLISPEVSALTTNNTLLNKEVQKGIYDGIIKDIAPRFKEIPSEKRIIEIAFLLNALHGLRLVKRYGGKVSVELHTDLSHDVEGIVHYGKRFHDIEPNHFIVKVPLTPSGVLGARKLHELNIPVNFTLLFSARQNMMVALLAKPAYTNVFLGRIGAYLKQNRLGEAEGPGEKTIHNTQQLIKTLREEEGITTKLIAASIRDYSQLPLLCGIDVMTIPPQVVSDALRKIKGPCQPMSDHDFHVVYKPGVATSEIKINKLWEVSDLEKKVFRDLARQLPENAWELEDRLREAGIPDIFPHLTPAESLFIDSDGKIPKHERWANAILKGEIAIDTLLNLAGLAAFTNDQKALDDRIANLIF
ncbi:transaldolase family protein [Thermophagus xiamenensis]|uniref:Transaldolase n=1 Tax=Thermophagus xiamenensis TaxID=385682 RepID=A0A1I2EYE7_9BACT|nr:transaldolase family protein [Thermophagus xiamenensis]SFE97496.1 transaldolase [Thermophagus xiamenensis]